MCFEKNKIASVWYKAVIHPILKPGKSPLVPLNHRGISLISTVAKVLSTILNTRLSNFMESQGIYAEEQNGFRRMRSCLDHLHTLTTVIRNRKAQKLSTFCVFIDNEKDFDNVHCPYLWYKLSTAGVQGHMLSVIQTMYSNLQSCVRVNGSINDWFAQTAGVRQGDTLVSTLFALFINDLAPEINGLRCGVTISNDLTLSILLYADDVVWISETEDGVQSMLDSLRDWSNRWKLKVNEHKSKVVHFIRASDEPTGSDMFRYGDQVLKIVPMYRYLGLDLYDTVDFSETVSGLSKSASRALGAITNKYFTHNGVDYKTYTKLFDYMVCPIMEYGCEIWGARKRDCMDVIQHVPGCRQMCASAHDVWRHVLDSESRETTGCDGPVLESSAEDSPI